MSTISTDSFFDELEKIAVFSPSAQDKVLSIAKKMQLPKASGRSVPMLGAAPPRNKLISQILAGLKKINIHTDASLEEIMKQVRKSKEFNTTKKDSPTIFPGGSKLERQMGLRSHFRENPVPPEQKKTLNSILKGHEVDEATLPMMAGVGHFGHRNPAVIFRESNRVATLPEGNEETKKFMKELREGRESSLFPKGMAYGEKRFSRHAIKRLSEAQQDKVISATREFHRQMKERQALNDVMSKY